MSALSPEDLFNLAAAGNRRAAEDLIRIAVANPDDRRVTSLTKTIDMLDAGHTINWQKEPPPKPRFSLQKLFSSLIPH